MSLSEFGGFDVSDVFAQVVEFVDLLSTFTTAGATAVLCINDNCGVFQSFQQFSKV